MKALLSLLAGVLFSVNATAGLIEVSTNWSSIYRDSATGNITPYLSGSASFFYEEGTNDFVSFVFYDQSQSAVFKSLDICSLNFINPISPTGQAVLWNAELTSGTSVKGQPGGDVFNMGLTDFSAVAQQSETPTLDHWGGYMFGYFANGVGTVSFNTNGAARAAVPEPGTLALFAAGMLGFIARRFRRA